MLTLAIIALAVVFLLMGSYSDIKTKEVPDRVSYGFIAISLLIASIQSFMNTDAMYVLNSLAVGVGYFIVGYLLFCLGQWGGGDVKIMTGIGCTIGYLNSMGYFSEGVIPYYLYYFLDMGFVALPYLIIYAFFIGIKNQGIFNEFKNYCKSVKSIILLCLSFLPSITALYFNLEFLAALYLLVPPLTLAFFYLKTVENVALKKTIDVSELREGDVITEDLTVNNEKIATKRNMEGLTSEQIQRIRELAEKGTIPREITIKDGIKFVPILLITFLLTIFFGNLVETFIYRFWV